jgi:SulP family sulfate permease
MTRLQTLRHEWLSNPRGDILAGIVVALALIPEAIGFSVIAGVDPSVGLYASFSIAVIIALVGGRPGMISAATAAIAVLIVPLVKSMASSFCSPPPSSWASSSSRPGFCAFIS